MPYYNTFDIVAAYLTFFNHYHGGMYSVEYGRLSRAIATYAKGFSFEEALDMSENAQLIYDRLVEKHLGKDKGKHRVSTWQSESVL
jgi:hypothetical protein